MHVYAICEWEAAYDPAATWHYRHHWHYRHYRCHWHYRHYRHHWHYRHYRCHWRVWGFMPSRGGCIGSWAWRYDLLW
ncbi:hypothetical protein ABT147_14395 [Streptomyces sp. NPDC001868]|uniref:hypothetical protein n=1 Tax=Streptomyces sp. NPDC001868 TaxID=3154401 RepID=UPI00331CBB0B